MTCPSSELYLKSTSLMSLHDRFTSLGKKPGLTDVSGNLQQLPAASLKNKRLALQMANWPSVRSALHNMPRLKHRLGRGNIKARLSRPLMRGGLHGVASYRGRQRGRGASLRGTLSVRCIRGLQGVVSGLVTHQSLNHQDHATHMSGPGGIQNRGGRASFRGKSLASRGRGLFVGGGRGGGRHMAGSRPVPTREELDDQLDDYMSMTKSHLDAQLDAYMAEVDSGDLL